MREVSRFTFFDRFELHLGFGAAHITLGNCTRKRLHIDLLLEAFFFFHPAPSHRPTSTYPTYLHLVK
jgi:hypothetical protein